MMEVLVMGAAADTVAVDARRDSRVEMQSAFEQADILDDDGC